MAASATEGTATAAAVGVVDLYELLGVAKTATPKQLRRGYHVRALQLHPDKNPEPTAEDDFKHLQQAYNILKNPSKRERYNRTGCTDDENVLFWDAYERYRGKPLTEEDIEEFLGTYQGSEEEKRDVCEQVRKNRGDVSLLLSAIMGSKDDDVARLLLVIEELFDEHELPEAMRKMFNKTKGKVLTTEELDAYDDDPNNDDEEEYEEENDSDEDAEMADFIVADDDDTRKEEEEEEEEHASAALGRKRRHSPKHGSSAAAAAAPVKPKSGRSAKKVTRSKKSKTSKGRHNDVDDESDDDDGDSSAEESTQNTNRSNTHRDSKATSNKASKSRRSGRSIGPAAVAIAGASASGGGGGEHDDDFASLRAAILGKGKRREGGFEAFANKWADK